MLGYSFLNIKGLILGAGVFAAFGIIYVIYRFWIKRWWESLKQKYDPEYEVYKNNPERQTATKQDEISELISSRYYCKCGQTFPDEKERKRHVFEMSAKEKGRHGKIDAPAVPITTVTAQPKDGYAQISIHGKYHAYIWEPNPGIVVARITKPVGKLWIAEPTLPKSGGCYFCMRDENNNLIPYDPRLKKLDPNESPERLYRATNAEEVVNPVYTSQSTLWEKINTLMPYAISFLILIAVIVKVGSK